MWDVAKISRDVWRGDDCTGCVCRDVDSEVYVGGGVLDMRSICKPCERVRCAEYRVDRCLGR